MTETDRVRGPALPAERFGPRLARHLGELLRLAWPVMLSRAGILVMAFTDIAMLGRYSPEAVGVASLALAIFVPVLVMSIGLGSGVIAETAQAYGRGDWQACGRAWRRAMVWGGVVSIFGAWIVWQAAWLLVVIGQDGPLTDEAGIVARVLAPGLVAQVIFAVCAFYLEATRRPMAALWTMLFANIANAALNWLLIFGNAGMPELGAAGAALASTLVRIGAALALAAFILRQSEPRAAGVIGPWETFWGPGGWRSGAMMRKLGLSAGLSNGCETVGFTAMNLLAAGMGTLPLAAYSISHNLVSTVFMIGLGLAIATGVRVGIETGKGRPAEAAFAGWTGLGTAVVIMSALAVLAILWRIEIGALYTNDPELALRAAAVIAVAAFIFIPDAAQVVMGQAVRALGDAWIAILAYFSAFFVLMVPLGWWFATWSGWDERGLAVAIILSCIAATGMLAWRFATLTGRGKG
ncbi:MAG: MATE family efflux transporter [Pseudomonadota bacterium]